WKDSGGTPAAAELYDPATNAFTPAGAMVANRREPLATRLPSGLVLIIGSPSVYTAELYDPATNTFHATAGAPVEGRAEATMTLLDDGRVLVTGGVGFGSSSSDPVAPATASSELYNPATDSFSAGPEMTTTRRSHVAVLGPDGRVAIAGGTDSTGVDL